MATILENIQKARFLPTRPLRDDLPTFQGGGGKEEESHLMGLRKRLSSFSGKIQPISSASAEWAIRRTRSAPSLAAEFAAGPLKRWWDWGVGWLLSRKLADDLEMNEEEAAALGRQSRGTWAHALYKLRSSVRRLVASDHSLPTTHRRKGASSLPAASSAHHHCKPAAPQFAYTQSFQQYGQAMAH
ncbi:hypothetical protein D1007_00538 [Hordeum vulgare]|uniref:Predicted protein n=1 Tax=Hordeum vulgare subsp. vulgare TaxID=112509 RepID=F2D579_HORVV|nr:uncharacterized protein LOC123401615 [Hordeum vulgare subsp. vulgare]KAE8821398.1 hypothetical protein D1007_00538 [Hordeum vulgare]KAI4981509.1 hypothetical protein ZWY2020_022001 [Hordeum vulgare]BAJ90250.1 predicted protein [Hordeum vulgare subsp. vulgare]BAJ99255.1 predicted protein [Hordeum vulgare subsp. vulgare]